MCISRQSKWQKKKEDQGLCTICGKNPLYSSRRCIECTKKMRIYIRNKYRISHNIPIDAPKLKRGRPLT